MPEIKVKKLKREELETQGVFSWPIWEKEASTFPWQYSEPGYEQTACGKSKGHTREWRCSGIRSGRHGQLS